MPHKNKRQCPVCSHQKGMILSENQTTEKGPSPRPPKKKVYLSK